MFSCGKHIWEILKLCAGCYSILRFFLCFLFICHKHIYYQVILTLVLLLLIVEPFVKLLEVLIFRKSYDFPLQIEIYWS
jgi:hypothetical protein